MIFLKRITARIQILILGLSFCLSSFADNSIHDHGLQFSSYSVSPDNRTSFEAPYGKKGIRFRNYFSLSFDMRVLMEQEKFGYISRIIIDNTASVDIYLRNKKGIPHVCIITEDKEIGVICNDQEELSSWNTITVTLEKKDGKFCIYGNGKLYGTIQVEGMRHYAKVCLGSIHMDGFSSTDSAPIVVRDIKISNRKSDIYCQWSLCHSSCDSVIKDDYGKEKALVNNAIWTIDEHGTWKEIFTYSFNDKVFPVIDNRKGQCFFISDNKVIRFDFNTSESDIYHSNNSVNTDKLTNNFIVIGDKIIYYDFDTEGQFASYDTETGQWDAPVGRKTHSRFLHHNKLFSPEDSSIIQIFGYGFHLYNNELHRHDTKDRNSAAVLEQISPRYMSSIHIDEDKDKVYIFGGRGNMTGIQEYGIESFTDLWEMDLKTLACKCLYKQIDTEKEIATPTFYMNDDMTIITGLFFFPEKSNTALHLREIDLKTQKSKITSKDIPYYFLDKDSFADMTICNDKCYVITSYMEQDVFKAKIYSISLPIINSIHTENGRQKTAWWAITFCILTVICGIAAMWTLKRKQRVTPHYEPQSQGEGKVSKSDMTLKIKNADYTRPGIYLLNGFRVTDKNGNDISNNFTPIMKNLLALIILHTQKYGGISNAELKEALWADKSDSSYFNNRSVLLHKIRTELETVCEQCTIRSKNNKWIIEFQDNNICDYIKTMEFLDTLDIENITCEQLGQVIESAHYGDLLAFVTFEGFDKFKAEYSDKMISLLSDLRDSHHFKNDDNIRELLCECIFLFDALDEDSIKTITGIFIKHKQITKAQNRFQSYRKEYQKIMGEEYEQTFNDFVKSL